MDTLKICTANVFGLISIELNNRQKGKNRTREGEREGKEMGERYNQILAQMSERAFNSIYRILVATNVGQFSYRSNRRTAKLFTSGVGTTGYHGLALRSAP